MRPLFFPIWNHYAIASTDTHYKKDMNPPPLTPLPLKESKEKQHVFLPQYYN